MNILNWTWNFYRYSSVDCVLTDYGPSHADKNCKWWPLNYSSPFQKISLRHFGVNLLVTLSTVKEVLVPWPILFFVLGIHVCCPPKFSYRKSSYFRWLASFGAGFWDLVITTKLNCISSFGSRVITLQNHVAGSRSSENLISKGRSVY